MAAKLRRTTLYLAAFAVLFATGFSLYQYHQIAQPGIIVLLYHKVVADRQYTDKYSIDPKSFEDQMAYLKKLGYSTLLPREIVSQCIQVNPAKTIVLTFDDGTEDHYVNVLPVLTRSNMKGVFCIVSKYVDSPGCLTQKEVKEMSRDGMEICSHSYTHPFLDGLDSQRIAFQLTKSKEDLERITGADVICLAPPGGWFNAEVVKVAGDSGYQMLFGCEIGTNDLRHRPFVFKRIEVLGGTTMPQFQRLLAPREILCYKLVQSLKFLLHDLIGSDMYHKLPDYL